MHKSMQRESGGKRHYVMQVDQERLLLKNYTKKEKQKTDREIDGMKKAAAIETETARKKGERNLKPAVEKIVSYVIME